MADSTTTISSPRSEKGFTIGDLVWARVKGYPFWPGIIIPDLPPDSNAKLGRKPKNGHLVQFFGANNLSWASEDQLKHYVEHREQMVKGSKSGSFKKSLKLADEKVAELTGTAPPALDSSTLSNISITATPKADKPSTPALFKTKKVNSTPTPVQRDYSRTPFKKEKRNFESTLAAGDETPVGAKSPRKSESKATESTESTKRAKVEGTPRKRTNSSPVKINESFNDDDLLPDRGVAEQQMEQIQIKPRLSKGKPSNLKFGFIGLGTLGKIVLHHLITSGHDITLWNRTPSKCKEFEKLGAAIAKTPGDVIRESDITFSCLSDAEASSKIFFGNCGVAHEINASKGYVELTSLDPTTSMDIEQTVKNKGGRYIEAPLICSIPKQMEEGKCIAIVAGDRSLFDDCGTCFQEICSHVYFLGENAGTAARLNIVLSTLFGNIVGSLLESLNLVERMGLFPKDFVEIISQSPFSSALIESKAQSMLDSTLVRDIPIDHIRRDLNYALQISNQKGFSTPITSATNEVFKQKKHHYY